MRAYYLTGFGLVAIAAAALTWTGLNREDALSPIFPIFIVIVGAVAVFGRLQRHLTPVQRTIAALVITLLFGINYRFLNPISIRMVGSLIGNSRWLIITQFCCALMVMQLFFTLHRSQTVNIGLLGLTAVLTAGMSLSESRAYVFYGMFGISYMGGCFFLCVLSHRNERPVGKAVRRVRWVLIAMTVFFILISGYVGGGVWYRHSSALDEWLLQVRASRLLSRFLNPKRQNKEVGFTDEVRLDSMTKMRKGDNRDAIALRVFADQQPGYLRANVLDHYENNRWDNSLSGGEELFPLETVPPDFILPGKDKVYLLTFLVTSASVLDIWPDPDLGADIFSTLDAVALEVRLDQTNDGGVYLNLFNEPKVAGLRGSVNYLLARSRLQEAMPQSIPQTLSEVVDEACLQLPQDISPQVKDLATKVFANCNTTASRHNAVVDYFHQNYTYNLGIQVPDERDPLDYFLLEKPAAHCEYFASGAVILLRLAGVPARMATGFVVAEKHPILDCWIARNAHAHAWVEAWDADKSCWVTLEPTPPGGQPDTAPRNRMDGYWDALMFRLQQLRVALYRDGIKGVLWWLMRLIAAMVVWLVTSMPGWIIIAVILMFCWRRYRRRLREAQAQSVTWQVQQLRRLLFRMDRRLKKHQLSRRPSETLHTFAQRLLATPNRLKYPQTIAQWYRHWTQLRYKPNPSSADIDELRQCLKLSKN
ncbi:MAG: hypothetical protein JW709_02120 [Sedimentisphaerales bacterium]|nr:hypothetical protein [Sedimentisphaerales bacterium]